MFIVSGLTAMAQCNLVISWTYTINGGNIEFTNTSTGVPSNPQFAWLYDGQSSSMENPTFPYDSTIQQVCFAIYSLDTTCEDSICGPLDNPGCNLNIGWNSQINGGNITFYNTSTGEPSMANYAWLYDGQSSNLENPTFPYNPGATQVCFAIDDLANNICEDSVCGPLNDTTCALNISWVAGISGGNITFYNTSTGMPGNPAFSWLYNGQSSSVENPAFPYDSTITDVCFAIYDIDNPTCEDSICGPINFDSTATINEIPELGVNVYPNPFSNELSITVENNSQILSVIITDLSGRVVLNDQIISNLKVIELSHLDNGGYLLFISDPDVPERTSVNKILKH